MPFYLEMSKNTTQQRDIYDIVIYIYIDIYTYSCTLPVIITMALWQLTAHHVPKCMSCHKAIVVITGRAHCFYDNIYIMLIVIL